MSSVPIAKRKAVSLTQEKLKNTKNAIMYVLAGGTFLAFSSFVGRPSWDGVVVAMAAPTITMSILVVLIARYFSLRADLSALGFRKTTPRTKFNQMAVSPTRVVKIVVGVVCTLGMLALIVNLIMMFTTG